MSKHAGVATFRLLGIKPSLVRDSRGMISRVSFGFPAPNFAMGEIRRSFTEMLLSCGYDRLS